MPEAKTRVTIDFVNHLERLPERMPTRRLLTARAPLAIIEELDRHTRAAAARGLRLSRSDVFEQALIEADPLALPGSPVLTATIARASSATVGARLAPSTVARIEAATASTGAPVSRAVLALLSDGLAKMAARVDTRPGSL